MYIIVVVFRSFRSRLYLERLRAWKTHRTRVRLRVWKSWWRKIPNWSIASTFWTGWVAACTPDEATSGQKDSSALFTWCPLLQRSIIYSCSQTPINKRPCSWANTNVQPVSMFLHHRCFLLECVRCSPKVGTKMSIPGSCIEDILTHLLLRHISVDALSFTILKVIFCSLSSGTAGRADSLWSLHAQHQPAAPGDFWPGHQDVLPWTGKPSVGPGAQPAAQVWRLSVQQCHGHGPGQTVASCWAWNYLE